MGSQTAAQKREREDPSEDDAHGKRLRAIAALKAVSQGQAAPGQQEDQAHLPQRPPQIWEEQAHPAQARSHGPEQSTPAAPHTPAPASHRANDDLQDANEAANGEGDAWAGDYDQRDAAVFDPDFGQDYDHHLNVEEQHWEAENFAQKLPPGWAKCPNAGTEIDGLFPTKAPFGSHAGQRVPPVYQWKPSDVVAHMRDKAGVRVGTVIDLTMSARYYKPAEFLELGVHHVKIRCKGHGEVPAPEHVNRFVWEVRKARKIAHDTWELEKQLIARYDAELKVYNERTLPDYEQQKAAGKLPPSAAKPKPPLQKLPLRDRSVIEQRELVLKRPRVIVVHCTHGFNRSGYMIVHYLMRNNVTATVAQCIQAFTKARPPGIYKDEYIQGLFRYYRQQRIEAGEGAVETPLAPAWKPGDESPENFVDGLDGPQLRDSDDEKDVEMKHDDPVGEEIHEEEANMYREHVVQQLRVEFLKRRNPAGEDDGMTDADLGKLRNYANRLEFPGSQPVSLSCDNQDLIYKHRYWSTWKADGTRYMAYLCHSGMYLIDRRMRITRVHMRFPLAPRRPPHGMLIAQDPEAWVRAFKVGGLAQHAPMAAAQLALHHMTLVEGEMVIDEAPGGQKERAFYVYDLMAIQGVLVTDLPWKQRYMLMDEVVKPRLEEAQHMRTAAWPHRYDYAVEPFRVLRKDFWPLHDLERRRQYFFPTIRHENDGLILQAYDAKYIPDTCNMLLKWKPASHNSVDFTLLHASNDLVQSHPNCQAALARQQEHFLGVWAEGRVSIAFDLDHDRLRTLRPSDSLRSVITTQPARVVFKGGEDPEPYHSMVIECNFDDVAHEWCFMRDRAKDKDTPNALNTYLKVVKSIISAIDEKDINEQFTLAYKIGKNKYAKDIAGQRALQQRRQQQRHSRPG